MKIKLGDLIDQLNNIAEIHGEDTEVFFREEYYNDYFQVESVDVEDDDVTLIGTRP